MEACSDLIKTTFPNIDEDILNYVEGVLESTCEDLETVDDVYDGIGEVLMDMDQDKTEDEVRKICCQLVEFMRPNWKDEMLAKTKKIIQIQPELAQKHVNLLNSDTNTAKGCIENQNIIEKPPKKKGKEKKQHKSRYGADEVTVNQRATRRAPQSEKTKESVNNKDIRLEDFDISYGKKELVIDATLVLEHGHR